MSDTEKIKIKEGVKPDQGGGKDPWFKVAGSKVWYFFNSLKLTLFVLITLAVVSIFGTVVEQNRSFDTYVGEYGEQWANIIMKLQVNDMYHSWWFTALLGMLALNIIVCTFERFPPKWKSLLKHKAEFEPKFIDRLSNSQTIAVEGDADGVKDKVMELFKTRRFKTMSTSSGGEHKVYAWKGMVGRFGSDITHISLLVILLGTILGTMYGYKDFKTVVVGDTIEVPNADFELRLDKFWIDYYDTGQVKQYNSVLTVVEDGRDITSEQIWVNRPLFYKGIRFYQSSYGMSWNKVEEAQLVLLKDGNPRDMGKPVVAKWREKTAIPGTDLVVRPVGYTADFAFDRASGTIYSKSTEPNNPAIMLEVYKNGRRAGHTTAFLKHPGNFPPVPGTEDEIAFTNFTPAMYSGLSVNKDPGTNVVWAGTILMGIGFILAFFIYHRRIWVCIRDTGNSSEIKLGGMINKNNTVLEKDIKEIVEAVKS